MRGFISTVAVVALLALPSRVTATPVTIDFDALASLDVVTNQFAGVTFSNATVLTAFDSLNEVDFPPHSYNNVVGDDGAPIELTFSTPVTLFSGFFTYATQLTLQAYDTANVALTPVVSFFSSNTLLAGDIGSSPNELIQVALSAGISRIVLTGDTAGGSFVLDDVSFTPQADTEPPVNTPVPEPGTIVLVGLAGVRLLTKKRARR